MKRAEAQANRVYLARSLSGTYAEYTLALESQVYPFLRTYKLFVRRPGVFFPYATAYRALGAFCPGPRQERPCSCTAQAAASALRRSRPRAQGISLLGRRGSEKGPQPRPSGRARTTCWIMKQPDYREKFDEPDLRPGHQRHPRDARKREPGQWPEALAQRDRVVVIGSRGETTVNPRDLMGKDGAVSCNAACGTFPKRSPHAQMRP